MAAAPAKGAMMAMPRMDGYKQAWPLRWTRQRGLHWRHVLVFASMLSLAACAVEVQNLQPAKELARLASPPGSVYAGWRVFQDRCAACHGPAGNGDAGGPDLLPLVREMGPRRFVSLVLARYDWNLPGAQGEWVEEVVQRRAGALTMPAWQDEPSVSAHIVDLYAYLSARAEGIQGPGRPRP